mmetsp:Transcript_63961/g.187636  ORF Transcript_63961/g.187636 Transcript_63961/m.187636 type:complete len:336 (+) Transcript_63961:842-1849(+)
MASISDASRPLDLTNGSMAFSAALMAWSTFASMVALESAFAFTFSRSFGLSSARTAAAATLPMSRRKFRLMFDTRPSLFSSWPSRMMGRFTSDRSQASNSALIFSSMPSSSVGGHTSVLASPTMTLAATMAASTSSQSGSLSFVALFFERGIISSSILSTSTSTGLTGATTSFRRSLKSSLASSSSAVFCATCALASSVLALVAAMTASCLALFTFRALSPQLFLISAGSSGSFISAAFGEISSAQDFVNSVTSSTISLTSFSTDSTSSAVISTPGSRPEASLRSCVLSWRTSMCVSISAMISLWLCHFTSSSFRFSASPSTRAWPNSIAFTASS